MYKLFNLSGEISIFDDKSAMRIGRLKHHHFACNFGKCLPVIKRFHQQIEQQMCSLVIHHSLNARLNYTTLWFIINYNTYHIDAIFLTFIFHKVV